jgi:hypothetical protein
MPRAGPPRVTPRRAFLRLVAVAPLATACATGARRRPGAPAPAAGAAQAPAAPPPAPPAESAPFAPVPLDAIRGFPLPRDAEPAFTFRAAPPPAQAPGAR